jgi:hypothetical protein
MRISPRVANLAFLLILLVYGFYAARFIERTSYVINGERYYVLIDEAMVSMRYAKNLAAGHGLVWNPGERVEGFTNPLWVVYMSLFHLLPIPQSKVSLAIQISSVLILLVNLVVVKKIAKLVTRSELLSLLSVFLTAFFFSLNNWALQGTEIGLLTLLISLAVWLAIQILRTGVFNWKIYFVLGLSTLVRIDVAIIFLLMIGFLVIADSHNRRKHFLIGGGTLLILLLGGTIFRLAYYGEWFPNAYYLNIASTSSFARIRRGVGMVIQFIWTTGWLFFAILLINLLIRSGTRVKLLSMLFLTQVLVSIYVGGDAWEHRGGANRFIVVVMPLFFILFVYTVDILRGMFVQALPKSSSMFDIASQLGLVVFIFISLFSFNTIITNDALAKWLLQKRPIFVKETENLTHIALKVRQITTQEAEVAVLSAGVIPYFSDRHSIDLLGKVDPHVARTKPRVPKGFLENLDSQPAYAKWDYVYSIGELQPDLIAQFIGETLDEARPFLEGKYSKVEIDEYLFYVRNDSPQILWDQVKASN